MIYKIAEKKLQSFTYAVDLSAKEYTKYVYSNEIQINYGDLVLKLCDYKYYNNHIKLDNEKIYGNAFIVLHLKTNKPIAIFERNLKELK